MSSGRCSSHDEQVRVTQPGVVASACVGLAVLAEMGAVVLPWGLSSAYDTIFFAVYSVTLTAVGALIMGRLPRHPVG